MLALDDPFVHELWLEVRDDITLVGLRDGSASREYAQVKASTSDSLWSIAKLCDRDIRDGAKTPGTSIVEKSLACDDLQSDPGPLFRIITVRDCNSDLAVLKLERSHAGRTEERLSSVHQALSERLGGCESPAGRDLSYWCGASLWEVFTEQGLRDANMRSLHVAAEGRGYSLTPSQLERAYDTLVGLLSDIASVREASDRILTSGRIVEAVEVALAEALPHLGEAAHNRLRVKLEAALVPEPLMRAAEDRRRAYTNAIYRPGYSTAPKNTVFEELNARLSVLLARFLADETAQMTGEQFHLMCMNEVEDYVATLPEALRPPLYMALGSMYETTKRCSHRFTREEPA